MLGQEMKKNPQEARVFSIDIICHVGSSRFHCLSFVDQPSLTCISYRVLIRMHEKDVVGRVLR